VSDDLNNTQQTGEGLPAPGSEPEVAPESVAPAPQDVPLPQIEEAPAAEVVVPESMPGGGAAEEVVAAEEIAAVEAEEVVSPAVEAVAEEVATPEPVAEVPVVVVSKAAAPAAKASGKRGRAKEKAVVELEPTGPKSENMAWYILKVQSNREDSIREGLLRRVKIAGLDFFFGDVIVPTEMVTEFKGGKKRVVKRKLYPGYLVVQMEINEETWFLVRETPGIGDFTGAAGHPTPMLPHEVSKIVARQEEKSEEAPKLKINFNTGDRVKINEGTFENFEGEVDAIDQTNGRVTVMINIFGRSTPVELEYWQIEAI